VTESGPGARLPAIGVVAAPGLPALRLATADELTAAANNLYSALVVATYAPADALTIAVAVTRELADRCEMTRESLLAIVGKL